MPKNCDSELGSSQRSIYSLQEKLQYPKNRFYVFHIKGDNWMGQRVKGLAAKPADQGLFSWDPLNKGRKPTPATWPPQEFCGKCIPQVR